MWHDLNPNGNQSCRSADQRGFLSIDGGANEGFMLQLF